MFLEFRHGILQAGIVVGLITVPHVEAHQVNGHDLLSSKRECHPPPSHNDTENMAKRHLGFLQASMLAFGAAIR
jgi:hypothetical protein